MRQKLSNKAADRSISVVCQHDADANIAAPVQPDFNANLQLSDALLNAYMSCVTCELVSQRTEAAKNAR